jgi:chemotaxis protein MotA
MQEKTTMQFPSRQPRRYAPAPLIGAALGLLIVVASVASSASSLFAFFNLAGLLIVVGGVIAVAFMSFETSDVRRALAGVHAMLQEPLSTDESLQRDMADIMKWAGALNQRRVRALGPAIGDSDLSDPFIRYGLNMVLSDYPPDDVRAMMTTASDATFERDSIPVDVLRAMASHAPAFGMVGTLVGMVAMLSNLNDNVANIGATLAVAFLSTLYGVISARMIYLPAAARLQQEVDKRHLRCHLITEGMDMLACKRTPSYIQDRLNGFLRPDTHDYFDSLAKLAVSRSPSIDLEADEVVFAKLRQGRTRRLQASRA